MNRKKLKRMADYIRTIPQNRFDMQFYGEGFDTTPECSSVGCAVGHCTVLDLEKIIKKYPDGVDYVAWSKKYTGLKDRAWKWCFSGAWCSVDNTAEGAARRIEWLLAYGLPYDSDAQEAGRNPLCYNKPKIESQKITSIGYTGEKRCYLNVSEDEAIKRYAESEGYTIDYVKINFEAETIEITDEFVVYDINSQN